MMGFPTKRQVSNNLGVARYLGRERDGSGNLVHYRGHKQNLRPIMNRVKALSQNQNPRANYKFLGSIPVTMLLDWLRKARYTYHDYAVNNDKCKERFKAWLMDRDRAKLTNMHHTVKPNCKSQGLWVAHPEPAKKNAHAEVEIYTGD